MLTMKNLGSEVEEDEEEGGWKLTEAFEMDTRSTTWPPRSYTCSFCRREFRSAQALGGHMNVHRRDRARFHHQAQAQAQTQIQVENLNRLRSNNNYELGSTSLMSCCSVDNINDPFISWANNVGFGVFYQFDDNNNNINNNHNCNVGVCDEMKVSEVISSKNNEVSEPIEELDLELRLGCMCTKIR